MKCRECQTDFESRRCTMCGALPDENQKKVRFEDILFSKKFQRRLWAVNPKKVTFPRDHIPWNEGE